MKQKTDTLFYRNFFSIYVILVLQNVVTLSVNLADNMMLGAYSETALSGRWLPVNQVQFIYQQLLMALGDGLVIFCSQYWGQRRTEPMKKIAAGAMWAGLGDRGDPVHAGQYFSLSDAGHFYNGEINH